MAKGLNFRLYYSIGNKAYIGRYSSAEKRDQAIVKLTTEGAIFRAARKQGHFNVTESERLVWQAEDRAKYEGFSARDEEIWDVMRSEINRGCGYRKFMGRWASNDA